MRFWNFVKNSVIGYFWGSVEFRGLRKFHFFVLFFGDLLFCIFFIFWGGLEILAGGSGADAAGFSRV